MLYRLTPDNNLFTNSMCLSFTDNDLFQSNADSVSLIERFLELPVARTLEDPWQLFLNLQGGLYVNRKCTHNKCKLHSM